MRHILAAGLALAGLAFGAGSALAQAEPPQSLIDAAKAEGELMFYGAVSEDQVALWVESFEKKYGIKSSYLRLTSGALVQRFVTENAGGDNIADVLMASAPVPFEMHGELFADLSETETPNLAAWADKWRIGGKGLTAQTSPMAVTFNTEMVPADEMPTTWKELADPKWKGRVMLTDPRTSETYLGWLDAMETAYGPDFIRALSQLDVTLTKSGASGAQMVAAGAYALNFPAYSTFSVELKEKGAPIDARIMVDPQVVSQSTVGIAANAPHPNAARLFFNYMLSEEGLKTVCGAYPVSSPGDMEGKFGCVPLSDPQPVDYTIADDRKTALLDLLGLAIQ